MYREFPESPTIFHLTAECFFDSRRAGPYHARAMGDPLRDRHSLRELALNKQVIEIAAKAGDFERLANAIEADLSTLNPCDVPGEAQVDWQSRPVVGQLRFLAADAPAGAVELEGEVRTTVVACCQRCLEIFDLPVETALQLTLSLPGEECEPRPGFEQWELAEERLRPIDIVDEALVMALPLSARHENDARCVEIAREKRGTETTRPFASLRAQMDETK